MTETSKDTLRPVKRFLCRLVASMGMVFCSILVVSAFIGVFRGYSVQLPMLGWIIPVIMIVCILYLLINKSMLFFVYLFYSVLIVSLCIGILQGMYYISGVVLYEQGHYNEAAAELKKETQRWYLNLRPNYFEPSSMQELAESYCQLEDYDKAISVYELIISRYQGVNREVAFFGLQHLKDGLQAIARYKEENQGLQNDYGKLYDIAHVYESDLNCNRKALDIYKTITEMNIPAEDKNRAYEAITRLTPAKNNNH